ncbi:MAG TPA: hypothetical protein DD381_06155 [Lentisphaeria bacterium]|nr:MAG: hypothetical protein A2X47_05260 [Lentisphaerae bacterium GWF2_38_69]HBM15909.1 hypothetical protein [Lentisphaeria bacterium]
MKSGDEIKCQFCAKDAFAVKETLMDGWIKKGDILKCSACGAKLADIQQADALTKQAVSSEKLDKLASFLGTEKIVNKKLESDGEKAFCKDCKYYIKHPFINRCGLHTKEVNPMDDCEDFVTPSLELLTRINNLTLRQDK